MFDFLLPVPVRLETAPTGLEGAKLDLKTEN